MKTMNLILMGVHDFCYCFYRLHVFQNASHEHHIESKDEYNKLLRDFLANAE